MKVVIMRHGDAVLGADDDGARALTAAGRQHSLNMALWLQTQLPTVDRVLVSPYLRAQQTWETISTLFPGAEVETMDELVPHGRASRVVNEVLGLQDEVETLLIISHLPLVGHLVSELCPPLVSPMFVTSAMAGIELQDSRGTLLWQQAPHLLKNL
jgi:phosphohistidine phosphatase